MSHAGRSAIREAAISMPSGSPSRRRQISATASTSSGHQLGTPDGRAPRDRRRGGSRRLRVPRRTAAPAPGRGKRRDRELLLARHRATAPGWSRRSTSPGAACRGARAAVERRPSPARRCRRSTAKRARCEEERGNRDSSVALTLPDTRPNVAARTAGTSSGSWTDSSATNQVPSSEAARSLATPGALPRGSTCLCPRGRRG